MISSSGGGRGRAEEKKKVEDYIKEFKWDQVKFQMDKPLKIQGQKI